MEEDNKSLLDKNKRRLKTPYQVETLEKFYDEYKYPTEQMKSQLAETTGLTEKQVSGWFCHRRLKEKRLLSVGETYDNLRQDRSSVNIQDRGSGHRQDSCGSRQEGDNNNRHFDLKEVESKRSNGDHVFTVTDCIPKHMIHNEEDDTDIDDDDDDDDDTSSGNSLPLQYRDLPNNSKLFSSMETSRYERPKMQVTRPSGYLKLKAPIENPAITAVRKQLDRHYRQDGPLLGIHFDPLPPAAFQSSTLNPDNALYDEHEDQLTPKTEYVGTNTQLESGMNMELNRARSKFMQGDNYEECYDSFKSSNQKKLSHNISSYSGKTSSSHMGEDYYYDDRKPDRMSIQIHKKKRMNPLPDSYNDNMVYTNSEKDGSNPKRPLIPKNGVPLSMEDGKDPRMMNKVIKRDHDDYPQHERKSSLSNASTRISTPKRSASDQISSSFSEDDETALTSSS